MEVKQKTEMEVKQYRPKQAEPNEKNILETKVLLKPSHWITE